MREKKQYLDTEYKEREEQLKKVDLKRPPQVSRNYQTSYEEFKT